MFVCAEIQLLDRRSSFVIQGRQIVIGIEAKLVCGRHGHSHEGVYSEIPGQADTRQISRHLLEGPYGE